MPAGRWLAGIEIHKSHLCSFGLFSETQGRDSWQLYCMKSCTALPGVIPAGVAWGWEGVSPSSSQVL
jgi:hypothetical protein